MPRLCPKPAIWSQVYESLVRHAAAQGCPPPPKPLILNGWAYTNDSEKLRRWNETVRWAESNGCPNLVDLPDSDFYSADSLSTYEVGPYGGPMYRAWDFTAKPRVPSSQVSLLLDHLRKNWEKIVGQDLAAITYPLRFTGEKARRLLVHASRDAFAPWGTWSSLSSAENERIKFRDFRAAINRAIAPNEVDHIDFSTDA